MARGLNITSSDPATLSLESNPPAPTSQPPEACLEVRASRARRGVVERVVVAGRRVRGLASGESSTSSGARWTRLSRSELRGVRLRMPRGEVRGVCRPVRGLTCWPRRLMLRGEGVRGLATRESGGFVSRKFLMSPRYLGVSPYPWRSFQLSISCCIFLMGQGNYHGQPVGCSKLRLIDRYYRVSICRGFPRERVGVNGFR